MGARAAATRAALHARACAAFGALWSASDQPVSPRFQPSSQHRPATITHGAASHRRYSSEAALNSSGRNARPARMRRATDARPARDQRLSTVRPARDVVAHDA
ncbi:L-type lectin-domain containing receptor kinase IX.1-like [Dorcoceras hygrometricum]|uniref:L-type lectin-domain containing receptor kinase IX.1-like n=1 Tax=Dorcoceras hygrometricum TaxID=472368 RepID=A0A2Z6ZRY9_9LAMI|nr:L-type lectin-domain containing receptor kinase IX.1-like [Dorcoceras hygrometricum]